MFLPIVTIGLTLATLFVKWLTTVALTQKKTRLSEVMEEHGKIRHRLKLAVGSVSITDAEIAKLKRSIRTHNRKIPALSQELKKLEAETEGQAAMARQKEALTEGLQKSRA